MLLCYDDIQSFDTVHCYSNTQYTILTKLCMKPSHFFGEHGYIPSVLIDTSAVLFTNTDKILENLEDLVLWSFADEMGVLVKCE